MCTICVTKPICVYNLCDKADFWRFYRIKGIFAHVTQIVHMSHKLYTFRSAFVTQIVHIQKCFLVPFTPSKTGVRGVVQRKRHLSDGHASHRKTVWTPYQMVLFITAT